jgi:hypothetical protein
MQNVYILEYPQLSYGYDRCGDNEKNICLFKYHFNLKPNLKIRDAGGFA